MSNRIKTPPRCSWLDCHEVAEVAAQMFDDDGGNRQKRWLCHTHAVEFTRAFPGRVWGDAECGCGRIHDVVREAGRATEGDL